MRKCISASLLIARLFIGYVNAQDIYTYAGNGTTGYTDSGGVRTLAEFNHPWGLAIDPSGNLFIADYVNSAIRKVSSSGIISTFAGTTTTGFCGDNGPATKAMMERPSGIALDLAGNLYIADRMNNRIRKVNTSGIITTIAGTGTPGYSGDGGTATAATFNMPSGITADSSGNIYIADFGNNVIRKIDASGIITTIAGTGTGSCTGDGGPASAATLSGPVGIAIDASGNFFIADQLNNVVRKIDGSSVITTFAGTGAAGYYGNDGPATAAQLSSPNSIAFDRYGNVYITEENNNTLRTVNSLGIITTIAGAGSPGYTGDGGPATNAELFRPMGIAIAANGNIYIADFINSVVRLIDMEKTFSYMPARAATNPVIAIYPNPADNKVQVQVSNPATGNGEILVQNMLGQLLFMETIKNKVEMDISMLPSGCYTVRYCLDGLAISSAMLVRR